MKRMKGILLMLPVSVLAATLSISEKDMFLSMYHEEAVHLLNKNTDLQFFLETGCKHFVHLQAISRGHQDLGSTGRAYLGNFYSPTHVKLEDKKLTENLKRLVDLITPESDFNSTDVKGSPYSLENICLNWCALLEARKEVKECSRKNSHVPSTRKIFEMFNEMLDEATALETRQGRLFAGPAAIGTSLAGAAALSLVPLLSLTSVNCQQGPAGLVGPTGDPGDQGITGGAGPKGDPGETGVDGAKGDIGDHGPKGIKGELGISGDQGQKGEKGEKGMKGDEGVKGDRGDSATGDPGDRGSMGATGMQGNQGTKGIKGDKGFKGDVGPQGAKGIKGDKGEKGFKGDDGDFGGNTGDPGDPGPTGVAGEKGFKGDKGDRGPKGPTGPPGDKGMSGIKGFTGFKGEPA